MSTSAVTPATPAVATEAVEQEVSLQERLNAATPEEYKTWERTGDIPPVKPKAAEPPPKAETPAVSKESSAAAPGESKPPEKVETAPATEPGKPQKKRTGDARILQLLDERKQRDEEWQRRFDELAAKIPKSAEPSAKTDSQPAAGKTDAAKQARPKLGDNDPKTGKPFASMDAWQDAVEEWHDARVNGQLDERLTKSEQQRAQTEQQRTRDETIAAKLLPGKDKYPDFEAVAFNPDLVLPIGSAADEYIRNSAHAYDVLYYLGQHPEILKGFYRYVPGKDDRPGKLTGVFDQLIHPSLQMMELAKIEARLMATPPVPASLKPSAQVTKPLPPPPTVLSTHGSPSGDAAEEALKKKDFSAWEAAENLRERKARRA